MILNQALKSVATTITDLPWVERYGGVGFKVRKDFGGATINGQQVPAWKNILIAEGLTNDDCFKSGKYKNLCPNSRYTNLLYWEVLSDASPSYTNQTPAKGITYTGTVRLTYWLNLARMGYNSPTATSGVDYSGLVGLTLVNAVTGLDGAKAYQVQPGMHLTLKNPKMVAKDARLIFPYDYHHAIEAFMVYPYDFGAIDFTAEVHVSPSCLPELVTGTPIECVTEW